MAKSSIPTPEESLAGMAAKGRKPMNKDGAAFTVAGPKSGKLMPKGGAQASDPTVQPVGVKKNVPAGRDRNGAAYAIKTSYTKSTSPEAGATQANGRVFQSVVNRTNPNFSGGVDSSY